MSSESFIDCAVLPTPAQNELYTCLDAHFQTRTEQKSDSTGEAVGCGVLSRATDVIIVRVERQSFQTGPQEQSLASAVAAALNPPRLSSAGESREPFQYPAILHMDRWLTENQQALAELRQQLQNLNGRIRENLNKLDLLMGAKVTYFFWRRRYHC